MSYQVNKARYAFCCVSLLCVLLFPISLTGEETVIQIDVKVSPGTQL